MVFVFSVEFGNLQADSGPPSKVIYPPALMQNLSFKMIQYVESLERWHFLLYFSFFAWFLFGNWFAHLFIKVPWPRGKRIFQFRGRHLLLPV